MVGIILKNIRKMGKLTQAKLGKKLNLAESTICNYETEYASPTFEVAIDFIKEYNFDIQFIDKDTKKVYTIEELSKEMDF